LALAGSDQPPAQAASFARRNLTAAPKVTDRAELREVIAATYRQVRWPSTAAGKYLSWLTIKDSRLVHRFDLWVPGSW